MIYIRIVFLNCLKNIKENPSVYMSNFRRPNTKYIKQKLLILIKISKK
jgi:hypothetical protein